MRGPSYSLLFFKNLGARLQIVFFLNWGGGAGHPQAPMDGTPIDTTHYSSSWWFHSKPIAYILYFSLDIKLSTHLRYKLSLNPLLQICKYSKAIQLLLSSSAAFYTSWQRFFSLITLWALPKIFPSERARSLYTLTL